MNVSSEPSGELGVAPWLCLRHCDGKLDYIKAKTPLAVMSPTDKYAHSTFCCIHNYMIIPRNVSQRLGLNHLPHDDMPERAWCLYAGVGRGVPVPLPWLSGSCEVELIILTARLCSSSPWWPFWSRFNAGEWEVRGFYCHVSTSLCFFKSFTAFFCAVLQRKILNIFFTGFLPLPPPPWSRRAGECLQGNLTQHWCWYKARGIPVIWVYTSWVLFPPHTY